MKGISPVRSTWSHRRQKRNAAGARGAVKIQKLPTTSIASRQGPESNPDGQSAVVPAFLNAIRGGCGENQMSSPSPRECPSRSFKKKGVPGLLVSRHAEHPVGLGGGARHGAGNSATTSEQRQSPRKSLSSRGGRLREEAPLDGVPRFRQRSPPTYMLTKRD